MLEQYLPIGLFILVGAIIGIAPIVMGRLVAPHAPYAEKNEAYECGFPAYEETSMRFDVRYYLVAILFIIFDLEIAFFFPWAVVLGAEHGIGWVGYLTMMVFLAVLVVGFIYEWCKGALEWE
ncbi:MAG: NADH-quinone oxidoreductase subunit A [Gammaproteobacteria bacterium]